MRTPAIITTALVLANSYSVNADVTTTINPASNWGIWEGWGTSLAWWAQQFGNRDDLADVFFTLKQTKFNGQTLPGLGFNIVRYNAGACSWNAVDGESMVTSPNVKRSRQMEAYWVDWKSTDPTSSSWNWYDALLLHVSCATLLTAVFNLGLLTLTSERRSKKRLLVEQIGRSFSQTVLCGGS
jgi:galactan endo-1,6-beta-galactosidase